MRTFVSLVLIALLSACSGAFRSTVVITRDDLERRIERGFPIDKSHLMASVALHHPRVVLEPGSDRIGVDAEVRVRLAVLVMNGTAGLSGRLAYDHDDATVYLTDCQVTRIEVQGLPPDDLGVVREAVDLALAASMTRIPVYELSGPKEQTMRAFIQSVGVRNGEVVVELGL